MVRNKLLMVGEDLEQAGVRAVLSISVACRDGRGDRLRLQFVFWNPICNALEAMRDVGDHDRLLPISAVRTQDSTVVVTVEDSDVGLDTACATDSFKAFCTTKATGMELGLAICRSILKVQGGAIRTGGRADRPGTCLTFDLPDPVCELQLAAGAA